MCSAPGRSVPSRSARVQASRNTRSCPRRVSRPCATAWSSSRRSEGSGENSCRSSEPGRCAFVLQGRPSKRSRWRVRALLTRSAITALDSAPSPSTRSDVDRADADPHVDPVQHRPREPRAVTAPLQRRAAAVLAQAPRFPAGAGIGGQDQLEPCRVAGDPTGPMEGDVPRLEGLAQCLQHSGREFGGLVEEEHPGMSSGDRAGRGRGPPLPRPQRRSRRCGGGSRTAGCAAGRRWRRNDRPASGPRRRPGSRRSPAGEECRADARRSWSCQLPEGRSGGGDALPPRRPRRRVEPGPGR